MSPFMCLIRLSKDIYEINSSDEVDEVLNSNLT